jgi:RimJ/RimL family protein N-acetyltransferase
MIASPLNGVLDFAICLNSDCDTASNDFEEANLTVIGKAGLWDGKDIGFIFNKDYWRKGYAFEAVDAIMRHIWETHVNIEVIKADVEPRNRASLNLLKKLGFGVVGRAEKTFQNHIGWCDSIYLEARRPFSSS